MRYLIFLLILVCVGQLKAQHPTFSLFAEEQFSGVDIYDVIQDDEHNYIFATDQGILFHNGYSYEPLSCPEMQGVSVFGLTKDSKGVIYCFNLHHQVFRIEHGEIRLFYTIPDYIKHHEIWLATDHNDNLLIQSLGLIKVPKNGEEAEVITLNLFVGHLPLSFHGLASGATVSAAADHKIAYQQDGEITLIDSDTLKKYITGTQSVAIYWVTAGDRVYAVERDQRDVFLFDEEAKEFEHVTRLGNIHDTNGLRIYTSENRIWIAGNFNGVFLFDNEFNPLLNGALLYEDYFISDIHEDQEGNTLISTFDDGILLIKNKEVRRVKLADDKVTCLSSDEAGTLFYGTDQGRIYAYKDEKSTLIYEDEQRKGTDVICYWPQAHVLLNSSWKGAQISEWNGTSLATKKVFNASIKNAYFTSDTSGVVAFNTGISRVDKKAGDVNFKSIRPLTNRSYNVVESPTTGTIYAGMSSGLLTHGKNGKTTPFKYGDEQVFANSLFVADNKVFIGTKSGRILILANDEIIGEIPFDHRIFKLVVHDDELYVLSNKGLFHTPLKKEQIDLLNYAQGLSLDHITDFQITNECLFVTNAKNIDYITLEQLKEKSASLPVSISKVLVNDQDNWSANLGANERKVSFQFHVSTLRERKNVRYRFKLEGNDEAWSEQGYEHHSVEYNALPGGDYTFLLQAINGSFESEVVRHEFSIDTPYYQKWWFYVAIVLASGLIIALLFNVRIQKMRSKNQERLEKQRIQTELLDTELKALRSQMNPHFIFNSLNSIQDLILKEDTDASYDYIVLFAELMRNTLNYSNQDFIPFEDEVDFLNVYLSLEKLRFKSDFKYEIDAGDVQDIKTPSLLIQPFVENALLHGLMHKEGPKKLTIRFALETHLICTIEDNGVGRARSKEIQSRQVNHQSFALEAIKKRLDILKAQSHDDVGYVIEDLYEKDVAKGTRVVLTIPFQRLY